jgi:hypothetical protein
VVDQVAEDVQFARHTVFAAVIDSGDLDRGHDGDAVLAAGLERLVHARNRVVVAQCQQLYSGLRGSRHHRSRLEHAIGARGVRL